MKSHFYYYYWIRCDQFVRKNSKLPQVGSAWIASVHKYAWRCREPKSTVYQLFLRWNLTFVNKFIRKTKAPVHLVMDRDRQTEPMIQKTKQITSMPTEWHASMISTMRKMKNTVQINELQMVHVSCNNVKIISIKREIINKEFSSLI